MRALHGLLGATALLLAGVFAPRDPGPARSEPLAAALAPLGPAKALASSLLWARLLTAQREAQAGRTAAFGRALLELHPDLEVAREYVANQLVVTEAPRAPDTARHDLLVAAGLALLDEGLALRDSPRLHGTLGRLLVLQRDNDPRFRGAAEAWLGDELPGAALEHVRRSELSWSDRVLLAGLLLERGQASLRAGDRWAARDDWQEARDALAPLHDLEGALIDQRLDGLARELSEQGVSPSGEGPVPEEP